MRNLMGKVPKAAQDLVATLVRSIFAQPDAKSVYGQRAMVVEQLVSQFPEAAVMLDEARDEILAYDYSDSRIDDYSVPRFSAR